MRCSIPSIPINRNQLAREIDNADGEGGELQNGELRVAMPLLDLPTSQRRMGSIGSPSVTMQQVCLERSSLANTLSAIGYRGDGSPAVNDIARRRTEKIIASREILLWLWSSSREANMQTCGICGRGEWQMTTRLFGRLCLLEDVQVRVSYAKSRSLRVMASCQNRHTRAKTDSVTQ